MTTPTAWTAVILAGGHGRRLGNVEKASVRIGGQTLLERILQDLPDEVPVVVVGPTIPTSRPVRFVLEEPRFGGPVAGLATALPEIRTPLLALLATDMPRAARLLGTLRSALLDDDEVLMPVDAQGVRQQLCSIVRRDALALALAHFPSHDGIAMRALMARLKVRELALTTEQATMLQDIDTPEDLRRAREGT